MQEGPRCHCHTCAQQGVWEERQEGAVTATRVLTRGLGGGRAVRQGGLRAALPYGFNHHSY